MSPYGEPDWTTPGDSSVPATQNAGTSNPLSAPPMMGGDSNDSQASGRAFLVFLAFWDMGLAAAMGTLGILTVIKNKPDSIDDVTEAFLGIYMAIFAAILCLYELCWMQPLPAINRVFRKNFGFMYGLRSKGMFLVFIAFLTIGLYDETKNSSGIKGLDWATGLGWLATGVYLVLIGFIWPDLLDIYKPPSAGLTTETAQDHANVV